MWATLACAATLALLPDQGGRLALTNAQFTQGYMGAERTGNQFLPGDVVYLRFDIENISVDETGRIRYRMGMELRDARGKPLFRQEPADRVAYNALGGTTLPSMAQVDVGLDQQPGTYTLVLTVTDLVTKATDNLERKFEVLKPAFGLVRLSTSADADDHGRVPPLGAVGSNLFVNFFAVRFGRDQAKKQPNVRVEMVVRDEAGNPTVARPFVAVANEGVPEKASLLAMQFSLALNRPGKFTVELKATDLIGNQIARLSFPLQVVKAR
jgi:hypothetical protein